MMKKKIDFLKIDWEGSLNRDWS